MTNILFLLFVLAVGGWAQEVAPAVEAEEVAAEAVLPTFLALHPDIHAFRAFADGGWDGNWYVGYNTCWIVKLPKAPAGDYARAFLGARLGRAKTRPKRGGATWDRDPIPGKVYMGISGTPAFSPAQSFFVADTLDMPQEPDYENPNLNVGHGEWFWTEVPLKLVNFEGPNYLAAWSNTGGLVSASSSPILGAAMDPGTAKEPRAWLNSGIAGVPPRDAGSSIGVPISFYLPSLVIKLVPRNSAALGIEAFTATVSSAAESYSVRFGVTGQDVESAWVEASPDGVGWERVSPFLRHPPFFFVVPTTRFGRAYTLSETTHLRAVAVDALGNLGSSEPVILAFVPRQPTP